jgi:glycine/D-amino acid oxidase-like deaminating enzyme
MRNRHFDVLGAAPRREKIAILGGGMASLTAAFALTDTEELRERYEIAAWLRTR